MHPCTTVDVLDSADTPIGFVYLVRRELLNQPCRWVYEVFIEGELLMSSLNPVSERQLATSGIAAHEGDDQLSVLIGGLGLGYTVQAALETGRASRVRVIDRLDFVLDWMKDGLLPLSGRLNLDDRVELEQGDVYAMLLGPATETYDVILVDVDHAPNSRLDPSSAPFYTVDGQRRVAEHLSPGGVIVVWSAGDHGEFAAVVRKVYPVADREYVRWTNHIPGETSDLLGNVLFLGQKGS